MYAKITCLPALGQVTIVPTDFNFVEFNVALETDNPSDKPWEVVVWHSQEHTAEWTSLGMPRVIEEPDVLLLRGSQSSSISRQWFSAKFTGPSESPVSFTVKFRSGENDPWKWAKDQFSLTDGQIIFQKKASSSNTELSQYLSGISQDLTVKQEKSDTPNTVLWSVTASVDAASGENSGYSNYELGTPTSFSRWFSLVRLWSPWLSPRHGTTKFTPDKEAVLASFQRNDGSHLVVLAISGLNDVLTLMSHNGSGAIIVNAQNDSGEQEVTHLAVALGQTFEEANAAVMYYARHIIMRYNFSEREGSTESKPAEDDDVNPVWLQNWYDGLAYCTWNGLGQHLSEQRIFDALDSLEKNGISVTNLIIDDNWQSLDHPGEGQFKRRWLEFEANKEGFPNGLQSTVSEIRKRHPNISHVAVWHALLGYWGGVSPDGSIAKNYKTRSVHNRKGVAGGDMLVVDAEDVSRFYADFYSFLSRAGIDSVKTDAQFFLDEFDRAPDRRDLIREYQDSWSINILRYFSAKAISCMSQTPQILFHSQMPSNKPRLLVRNSDDFFPEVPASHPWHIFCNAYNALFTQHLNVLPDWDMFQTSHPWATFHGAARCVSGGPIYITDVPGQHDYNLINQMTARTPRGTTAILRPSTVGKTLQAYVGYDDPVLLKIGTYDGMAKTGSGIVGVFNTTKQPLSEFISLSSFPGTEQGTYLIRSHRTGQISRPMSRGNSFSFVDLELPVQDWEILTAYPVRSFRLERHGQEVAGPENISIVIFGLLGKMTGAAAIVNTQVYVDQFSGRLHIWASLKALGTYGIYISELSSRSIDDDFMGLLFGRPVPRDCVKVGGESGLLSNVLEVDLERAWKESDQHAGWSNEVAIEFTIR